MSAAFSVFLVLVTVGSFWLQVRRIRSHGPAGVSPSTWLGLLASVLLWSVYGLAIGDWTIIVANVAVVAVATAVIVALIRAGASSPADLGATVAVTAAVAAGGLAAVGPGIVGAAASVLVVARIVPQLVAAIRASDVVGVSVTTWVGNVANKVPWTIYGIMIADLWIAGAAALAVVLSLGIVTVVLVRRRSARRVPVPA